MPTRHLLHPSYVRAGLALLLAAGAACSPDAPPTGPEILAPPADLAARAFELTIEVASGRVSVSAPVQSSQARANGPSFSLLGRDAITLHAGDCTFTTIPNNLKQKRCSLQLAIENRLRFSDLVTPTSFPRPPQGVTGLLVFPFTSGGLSTTGGVTAVPNTSWDEAPANFFNDFASCSGTGKTSDCYRWERYPSPLAGGETSAARTVGFDVDKAAQSVSIYILVAADVRDAEPKSLALTPVAAGCGTAGGSPGGATVSLGAMRPGRSTSSDRVGLCTFELPDLLKDKSVVSATLTLEQVSMTDAFAQAGGRIRAQSAVFPVPMPDNVFANNNTTILNDSLATLSDSPEAGPRSVDVLGAVMADLAAGRTLTQYRLDSRPTGLVGDTEFAGVTGDETDPRLIVTYRER